MSINECLHLTVATWIIASFCVKIRAPCLVLKIRIQCHSSQEFSSGLANQIAVASSKTDFPWREFLWKPAKSKTNKSKDSAEHSGYAQSFVVFIVGECSPSKNCSEIVWDNHRYLNISWDLTAIWLPCWFNKGELHQLARDQDCTNSFHSVWFLRVFQCVYFKGLQSVQAGQAFSSLIEQWIG